MYCLLPISLNFAVLDKFNSRFFNHNFRLKVYGCGYNQLFGYSGFVNLLGYDLAYRLFCKALSSSLDVYHYRLRRGLKVSFYYK